MPSHRVRFLGVIMVGLLACAPVAVAATYYVANAGSDDNSGLSPQEA